MRTTICLAVLAVLLTGCGPSAYEKAMAKATGAELLLKRSLEGREAIEKIPARERTDEDRDLLEIYDANIAAATKELFEATEALRKLGS